MKKQKGEWKQYVANLAPHEQHRMLEVLLELLVDQWDEIRYRKADPKEGLTEGLYWESCGEDLVPTVPGITGTWPFESPQKAFVEGCRFWHFKQSGTTIFPSERDEAEAEAIKRYGQPVERVFT